MTQTQNGVLKKDDNAYPVMGGTSSLDNLTIINSSFDPVTRRLLVDNSGSGTGTWMPPETPVGAINGSNVTYTLSYIPVNYSGFLFVNGQYYNETTDYTITSNIITMTVALDSSFSTFPFKFKGQFYAVAPPGPADSVAIETPTGTINGSNPTFIVSNAPTYLVIDGFVRFSGFGYTYSSGTITVDSLVPVTESIFSIYTTSSAFVETPSGTINGTNTVFTVSNTPVYVVIDGLTYVEGFGYTYLAGTITTSVLVAPTSYIRSVYSVGTGGVETPVGSVGQGTFTVSSTPKYELIDNLIRFSGYGYSYAAPTVTVDSLVIPINFIRSVY